MTECHYWVVGTVNGIGLNELRELEEWRKTYPKLRLILGDVSRTPFDRIPSVSSAQTGSASRECGFAWLHPS